MPIYPLSRSVEEFQGFVTPPNVSLFLVNLLRKVWNVTISSASLGESPVFLISHLHWLGMSPSLGNSEILTRVKIRAGKCCALDRSERRVGTAERPMVLHCSCGPEVVSLTLRSAPGLGCHPVRTTGLALDSQVLFSRWGETWGPTFPGEEESTQSGPHAPGSSRARQQCTSTSY